MMTYIATAILAVLAYLSAPALLVSAVIVLAGALVLQDRRAQRRIRERLGRG